MASELKELEDIGNEVLRMLRSCPIVRKYDIPQSKNNNIGILNKCISKLKNILKENKALPDFFENSMASVPGEDSLETITKLAAVVEMANRIAKLPACRSISRIFYAIKDSGIQMFSGLKAGNEIAYKGSMLDNSGRATYSLQIGEKNDDKGKYAVVSWHLNTKPRGPNAYLIEPSNPKWQEYKGENVIEYNPPDRDFRQFGMEDRYNELGFIVLQDMLTDRRKDKLQDRISRGEEKIKLEIRGNYGEDIKKKLATIMAYCRGKNIEERYENIFLMNKILGSLSFGKGINFEELVKKIGAKIDAIYTFEEMYEGKGEKLKLIGYDMLENLEKAGIDDFEKGIEIIKKINEGLGGRKVSLSLARALVGEIGKVFDTSNITFQEISSSDSIEMTLMLMSEGVKNKEIEPQEFASPEKIRVLLETIKNRVHDRVKEMTTEGIEDRISVDEVLEFVNQKQCAPEEIMKIADELLAFAYSRDKKQDRTSFKGEIVQHATDNLSTKSILDLRKKIKEEGYIGGGRY